MDSCWLKCLVAMAVVCWAQGEDFKSYKLSARKDNIMAFQVDDTTYVIRPKPVKKTYPRRRPAPITEVVTRYVPVYIPRPVPVHKPYPLLGDSALTNHLYDDYLHYDGHEGVIDTTQDYIRGLRQYHAKWAPEEGLLGHYGTENDFGDSGSNGGAGDLTTLESLKVERPVGGNRVPAFGKLPLGVGQHRGSNYKSGVDGLLDVYKIHGYRGKLPTKLEAGVLGDDQYDYGISEASQAQYGYGNSEADKAYYGYRPKSTLSYDDGYEVAGVHHRYGKWSSEPKQRNLSSPYTWPTAVSYSERLDNMRSADALSAVLENIEERLRKASLVMPEQGFDYKNNYASMFRDWRKR